MEFIETGSRMEVIRDWKMGQMGNGEILMKWYKLPVMRYIPSEDLMYSMVTIVNNLCCILEIS